MVGMNMVTVARECRGEKCGDVGVRSVGKVVDSVEVEMRTRLHLYCRVEVTSLPCQYQHVCGMREAPAESKFHCLRQRFSGVDRLVEFSEDLCRIDSS